MAQVSRRIINKDLADRIFELFIKTVADFKRPSDVLNFIEDLLSPTEKVMLTKRLAIAILLSKGYTYEEIDQILKVSRPTIMTVSYFLKSGKGGYQKVVNEIINSQKREELADKIEELLMKLSPPKMVGSAGYLRKQKAGKELFRRRVKRSLI